MAAAAFVVVVAGIVVVVVVVVVVLRLVVVVVLSSSSSASPPVPWLLALLFTSPSPSFSSYPSSSCSPFCSRLVLAGSCSWSSCVVDFILVVIITVMSLLLPAFLCRLSRAVVVLVVEVVCPGCLTKSCPGCLSKSSEIVLSLLLLFQKPRNTIGKSSTNA